MDKQFVNKQELNAVPSAVRLWLFNLKINTIQIIVTGLLQKKLEAKLAGDTHARFLRYSTIVGTTSKGKGMGQRVQAHIV